MSRLHRVALRVVRDIMGPRGWSCRIIEGGKHSMVEACKGAWVYRFTFPRGSSHDPKVMARYIGQNARRALREALTAAALDERA